MWITITKTERIRRQEVRGLADIVKKVSPEESKVLVTLSGVHLFNNGGSIYMPVSVGNNRTFYVGDESLLPMAIIVAEAYEEQLGRKVVVRKDYDKFS